ncbi:serine/arginine repetitive matrix protein 1-like [Branchiostoma lanceolatum]|uniref:serine/arginine repetitive matrix protein 1-like n=1 Tax=Branchiostoma lanceolatum TaxID=7740 RepID=UPI003456B73F
MEEAKGEEKNMADDIALSLKGLHVTKTKNKEMTVKNRSLENLLQSKEKALKKVEEGNIRAISHIQQKLLQSLEIDKTQSMEDLRTLQHVNRMSPAPLIGRAVGTLEDETSEDSPLGSGDQSPRSGGSTPGSSTPSTPRRHKPLTRTVSDGTFTKRLSRKLALQEDIFLLPPVNKHIEPLRKRSWSDSASLPQPPAFPRGLKDGSPVPTPPSSPRPSSASPRRAGHHAPGSPRPRADSNPSTPRQVSRSLSPRDVPISSSPRATENRPTSARGPYPLASTTQERTQSSANTRPMSASPRGRPGSASRPTSGKPKPALFHSNSSLLLDAVSSPRLLRRVNTAPPHRLIPSFKTQESHPPRANDTEQKEDPTSPRIILKSQAPPSYMRSTGSSRWKCRKIRPADVYASDSSDDEESSRAATFTRMVPLYLSQQGTPLVKRDFSVKVEASEAGGMRDSFEELKTCRYLRKGND